MSFEKVQRLAFSLGTSLRQKILQSASASGKVKVPLGVKTLLPRAGYFQAVENDDHDEQQEAEPTFGDIATQAEVEVDLAHTQLQLPLRVHPHGDPLQGQTPPGIVLIPTLSLIGPGVSVMSEPVRKEVSSYQSGVRVNKPPICFLCYGPGHLLAESLHSHIIALMSD
jgi:hypothetical protein